MYRFFNAGHKIDEVFPFSLPADTGADVHVIGRWNLTAPREGWFDVPRELSVGVTTLAVQFVGDIKRRFGKRGVVLLDPAHNPETEDEDKPLEAYPVAPTEALVIARAEKLWDNYLEEICKSHFEDVQNAMSAGGAPRAARGFTAHALKLKGYRDSANDYFLAMKDGAQGKVVNALTPEVAGMMAQMQQQNQLMMSLVMAIATGKPISPELLQQLTQPPNGDPERPQMSAKAPIQPPENAGQVEVEGSGATSLEQRINRKTVEYDTAKSQPADKKGRTAAAVKQL